MPPAAKPSARAAAEGPSGHIEGFLNFFPFALDLPKLFIKICLGAVFFAYLRVPSRLKKRKRGQARNNPDVLYFA
jgi:hypothetical protein